jgi:hypothetical protein
MRLALTFPPPPPRAARLPLTEAAALPLLLLARAEGGAAAEIDGVLTKAEEESDASCGDSSALSGSMDEGVAASRGDEDDDSSNCP